MLKSMTGFGRAEAHSEKFHLTLEIKSVNQRFLDLSFRIPRGLFPYEEEMTRRIKEKLARGKVEVFINIQNANIASLAVDMSLARAYQAALDKISEELNLSKNTNVEKIAAYQGVLSFDESIEGIDNELYDALNNALETLDAMRMREGKEIEKDFRLRLDILKELVNDAEKLEPIIVSAHRERIQKAIKETLENAQIDEGRLLTEVALYADKVNYTEEIVRLKSHLDQFEKMLDTSEPCGRKLDFLIQEMNREANTIGSKGNHKDAQQIVVDIKAEIEKLREQTQNIE